MRRCGGMYKRPRAMSGTLIRAQLAQEPGNTPHPEAWKLPEVGACSYRHLRDGVTVGGGGDPLEANAFGDSVSWIL